VLDADLGVFEGETFYCGAMLRETRSASKLAIHAANRSAFQNQYLRRIKSGECSFHVLQNSSADSDSFFKSGGAHRRRTDHFRLEPLTELHAKAMSMVG